MPGAASVNPVDGWRRICAYEDALSAETGDVQSLQTYLNSRDGIVRYTSMIATVLEQCPAAVQQLYGPWCTDPTNYDYPHEAYFQLRSLNCAKILRSSKFAGQLDRAALCTRILLRPSSFNGSPRIKRLAPWSYIIFPALSSYWAYEIMGFLSATLGHGHLRHDMIREYLLYLIALRTFEKDANVYTSWTIDYMLDAIVPIVTSTTCMTDGLADDGASMASSLIYCMEQFIIMHEWAHEILDHPAIGTLEMESGADRLALDMLLAMDTATYNGLRLDVFAPTEVPWLGYTAVRMWTLIRLAAEVRAATKAAQSPEDAQRDGDRIIALMEGIGTEIERSGVLRGVKATPFLKRIELATETIVSLILAFELDQGLVDEVKRRARAYAKQGLMAGIEGWQL